MSTARRILRFAGAVGIILAAAVQAAAQTPAPPLDTSRGLRIQFADGKSITRRLAASPAAISDVIASSLSATSEMQAFREVLLRELEAVEESGRTPDGATLSAWLPRTIVECEHWASRLIVPDVNRR